MKKSTSGVVKKGPPPVPPFLPGAPVWSRPPSLLAPGPLRTPDEPKAKCPPTPPEYVVPEVVKSSSTSNGLRDVKTTSEPEVPDLEAKEREKNELVARLAGTSTPSKSSHILGCTRLHQKLLHIQ